MRPAALLIAALLLVSCGQATADLEAQQIYFRGESSGGCFQLGPNCLRLDVYGDGTVQAYRVGETKDTRVATGSIDPGLVTALYHETVNTDLQALRDELPPGECQGCVDGIDTAMTFLTSPTAEPDTIFSSVDVRLDPSEPLFDIAWKVYRAAEAAVDVPVIAP